MGCGQIQAWVVGEVRSNLAMGMMQHQISTMEKVAAMVKRDHQSGNGLGHQKGGGRGKKSCPHHQTCQRGGTVMNGIWAVRGKGRGTETGKGKETGTGRGTEIGTGTGMTEIAMVIITDTGSVKLTVMKTGIGEGHLGDAAGQGRSITRSGDECRTSDVADGAMPSVGVSAIRGGIFFAHANFQPFSAYNGWILTACASRDLL